MPYLQVMMSMKTDTSASLNSERGYQNEEMGKIWKLRCNTYITYSILNYFICKINIYCLLVINEIYYRT